LKIEVIFLYKNKKICCENDLTVHSKKKLTHFATKSSEIIIASRKASSALQKRVLLYKKEANNGE
jgi:hypothetical protein